MPLYDFQEFLKLSSVLNYNLSTAVPNRYNVLLFLMGEKKLHSNEVLDREQRWVLMEALNYLFSAYRQKRRRLGPMAVLHPLRAAALYTRSAKDFSLIDLLSALLHDILEDVQSTDFDTQQWKEMESQLYGLLDKLDQKDEEALVQRLKHLTRLRNESYYEYIGRLLESSAQTPELIHIKLADRLDNTLDMRIVLQDPIGGVDFFQTVFQVLFVNNYSGYRPKIEHPASATLNGSRRLYQLFKNAVLLSLIRQMADIHRDPVSQTLFEALSDASLLEAQRSLLHLMGYHHQNLKDQREMLLEAMNYCYSGKTGLVTEPTRIHMLDGLFSSYFGNPSSKIRNQQLDRLYRNKPLMFEASVAFIVIFLSFLNREEYYVKGVSAKGISPR